jgi:tetracycline resistance efflux pump
MEIDYGILSLLPPLLAIIMAMITKQVILSLFAGVWVAATMIVGWNPVLGLIDTFRVFISGALGDTWNASVLIMLMLVGAFAAMIEKGGGAHAFAQALSTKVKTRKQGQLITWLGGLSVFFSDSSNPVIVGPIFRPITDSLKISREKLAYIVDSTSAAVPALLPITAWGAFLVGLIATQYKEAGITEEPFYAFVYSMPYMFYMIGCIFTVFLIAMIGKDFGPMRKAEERAFKEGKLIGDNAKPIREEVTIEIPEDSHPTVWNMIIPIIILIIMIFTMFLWTGGFPAKGTIEALGSGSSVISLTMAFFVASIVAGSMSIKAKVFTFSQAWNAWVGGIRQMLEAILILILAWAIGSAAKAVGTSGYIVSVTEHFLTPSMMYVSIFVAASITAFSTGTSWGTFGIFMPIAIPIALGLDASVYPAIAAVICGGVFGDHCSPISDTTVLSSIGCTCDHIDHVKTQLPYAAVAGISTIVGFIAAGISGSPFLSLIVAMAVLVGLTLALTSFFGVNVEDVNVE